MTNSTKIEKARFTIAPYAVVGTLLVQAFLVLWVYGLYRFQVQHPSHWPVSIAVVLIIIGMHVQTTVVIRSFRFRQNRCRELSKWSLAILPGLLLLWGGLYTHRITSNRIIPDNLLTRWMASAGSAVADLEIRFQYRHRYDGERVTMFCTEAHDDASELISAMDQHILKMEDRLGRRGVAKAHWIRGRALGRSNFQFLGLAMSDFHTPEQMKQPGLQTVDRHELAHFTIGQFLRADSSPPCVILEGWAQAMSETREQLAVDCWRARYRHHQSWRLAELTSSPWYHIDNGPVYSVGGAFVDYLIRHYGEPKFLDLYLSVNEANFKMEFKRIYGESVVELEPKLWAEVELMVPEKERKRDRWIDPQTPPPTGQTDLWESIAQVINGRADVTNSMHAFDLESTADEKPNHNEDRRDSPIEHLQIDGNIVDSSLGKEKQIRMVDDFWNLGKKHWQKQVMRNDGDDHYSEFVSFVEPGNSYVLDRQSQTSKWQANSTYDQFEPKDRHRFIANSQQNQSNQWNSDFVVTGYLAKQRSDFYTLKSVQVEFDEDKNRTVKVIVESEASKFSQAQVVTLTFDPDLGWRLLSEEYNYDVKGSQRQYLRSFVWDRTKPQPQLIETIAQHRDADGKVIYQSDSRCKRELLPIDAKPPFELSDFDIQTARLDWPSFKSYLTIESGLMTLVFADVGLLFATLLLLKRNLSGGRKF